MAAVSRKTPIENTHRCPTVAGLASRANFPRIKNGDYVQLLGYYAAGDGGGQTLIYRSSGKGSITVDGGFYFNGFGAADYFEAADKSVANARLFGAKGDYSTSANTGTDDTAAIQAAINAARRQGTDYLNVIASEVRIPRGFYRITEALTCASSVHIRGDGHNNTTIVQTTGGQDGMTFAVASTFIEGVVVENLRLVHRVNQSSGTTGLAFRGVVRGVLRNVHVRQFATGFAAAADTGTGTTASQDLSVNNCHFQSNVIGASITSLNQAAFVNCWFNQNATGGCLLTTGLSVNFYGCLFQSSTDYGLRIRPDSAGSISAVMVNGCYFEQAGTAQDMASVDIGEAGKTINNISVHGCLISATSSGSPTGRAGIRANAVNGLSVLCNRNSTYAGYKQIQLTNANGHVGGYVINGDWFDQSGGNVHWLDVQRAVATGSRPTLYAAHTGHAIFDTTLGQPIWWDGSGWVDASGETPS